MTIERTKRPTLVGSICPSPNLKLMKAFIEIGGLVAAVVRATLFNPCPASAAEGCRLDKKSPTYEVPAQNALDLADEVTLEAWVRADRKSTRLNSSHLGISYAVF